MGLMIPVFYDAEHLTDPKRLVSLFTALSITAVYVSGWKLRSKPELEAWKASALHATNITFDVAGTCSPEAVEKLTAFVTGESGYFDVGTEEASLRVWPNKAWVHRLNPLTEIFDGVDLGRAYRIFRDFAEGERLHAHASGFAAAHLDNLIDLTQQIQGALTSELVIPTTSLESVLSTFPEAELELQAARHAGDILLVSWPEGEVSTVLLAPVRDEDVARWQRSIATALGNQYRPDGAGIRNGPS